MTEETAARPAGNNLIAWTGVAVLCLSAILAAGVEALLVPLYAGGHLFPITIVLTVATNIALPLLARALVPRLLAVVLPFLFWLAMMIAFGIVPRPEGDVILPGGPPQWVSYAVILGGALAGVITVVSATPPARVVPAASVGRAPAPPASDARPPAKKAPANKAKAKRKR